MRIFGKKVFAKKPLSLEEQNKRQAKERLANIRRIKQERLDAERKAKEERTLQEKIQKERITNKRLTTIASAEKQRNIILRERGKRRAIAGGGTILAKILYPQRKPESQRSQAVYVSTSHGLKKIKPEDEGYPQTVVRAQPTMASRPMVREQPTRAVPQKIKEKPVWEDDFDAKLPSGFDF